jgi:hypothetical protein
VFRIIAVSMFLHRRSQWSRGLQGSFAAARLLRLWVRIPPVVWMFSVVKCCKVEVSATSRRLVQRSATECGAIVGSDLETSRMRRP